GVSFFAPNGECLRLPFKTGIQTKDAPGITMRRIDFDNFLARKAKSNPLIEVREGITISKYEKTENGFQIYEGTTKIDNYSLLVIANGAQSGFNRHFLGRNPEEKHYSAGLRQYYKN